MTGSGTERATTDARGERLADRSGERPVSGSETLHHGIVVDLVRDQVDFAPGVSFDREYVRHPGAVAVLALDEDDRVLLIRQYRHPAAATLWELPAGLLDHGGEAPHLAARRELREETDHDATTWHTLVDVRSSPGGSDEVVRVYLAGGLTAEAEAGFERAEEEAEIQQRRVPLDEVVDAVLAGDLTNATLVAGILALAAVRSRPEGRQRLRAADVPFPTRREPRD